MLERVLERSSDGLQLFLAKSRHYFPHSSSLSHLYLPLMAFLAQSTPYLPGSATKKILIRRNHYLTTLRGNQWDVSLCWQHGFGLFKQCRMELRRIWALYSTYVLGRVYLTREIPAHTHEEGPVFLSQITCSGMVGHIFVLHEYLVVDMKKMAC